MTTRHKIIYLSTVALALAWAGGASAYTPKWLSCDGQEVTTADGKSTSAPAHDVYVYDDDGKNFFKHSDARKSEDIEPVSAYTDSEIRWGSKGSGSNDSSWDGRLDRKALSLQLNYKEKGSTIVWTEQCKPAQP